MSNLAKDLCNIFRMQNDSSSSLEEMKEQKLNEYQALMAEFKDNMDDLASVLSL
jgi:hypothetical protein